MLLTTTDRWRPQDAKRCRVLLVDETSMRRRHRYVTVLQNGETGEVLAMVAHRNAAALSGFLVAQGHRWRAGVKVVVTDGSSSYKAAVDVHLGHATHVLDRFHVVRWFAAGLTLVRREAQDHDGAVAALERFTDLYATGEIPEFHHVVNTILQWSEEILAFHQPKAGRASNGRLEGTNNKLQVLRRVAYGFTVQPNFEARGILACPAVTPSPPPTPATLTP